MATAAAITGTWFPSGYYGHYRSRTRNDILQEYRHAASPVPPRKFVRRVRLCPDAHSFSHHDNKHSFPTDASYFDGGMGRKKVDCGFTVFKPDLMAWMPHAEELRKRGAAVSLYKLDFQENGPNSRPVEQIVSPRIRHRAATQQSTDARNKWLSDYKMYFQHGQPSTRIKTDFITGKNFDGKPVENRTYEYFNTTGKLRKVIPHYLAHTESAKRRAKSAPVTRLSVGDCLVWPQEPLNEPIYINNRHDPDDGSCYRFKNPLSDDPPRVIHPRPAFSATIQPRPPMSARTVPQPTETQVPYPQPPSSARVTTATPRRTVVYHSQSSNDSINSEKKTKSPEATTDYSPKGMTPAATEISTFTPVESSNLNKHSNISPPTILVS